MATPPETWDLKIDLAPDVKERLIADANEQGTSMHSVGVAILAAYFGVRVDATRSRRNRSASAEARTVIFHVPPPLWRKVHAAAGGNGRGRSKSSKIQVVDAIFREHYQLEPTASAA